MTQINDDYYEDLDREKMNKIIDLCIKGEKPKPGSYTRKKSEPEDNRKTLMEFKNA